jgi:hypothetical protein
MKKKNRKRAKQQRTARHEIRATHAKRRENQNGHNGKAPAAPWLRILPTALDDELDAEEFRESAARRNGRRQPQDVDLYTPGSKPRTR